MTTINVYLNFKGNCKAAFEFYKAAFGGSYESINTYGEMPPQEGMPPLSDEEKQMIMHVSLPISKETILMGSDTGGAWTPEFKQGNNFAICISPESKASADRLFTELSKGGTITMPLEDTFWGAYFGMFTDRFGIGWMINYREQHQ